MSVYRKTSLPQQVARPQRMVASVFNSFLASFHCVFFPRDDYPLSFSSLLNAIFISLVI